MKGVTEVKKFDIYSMTGRTEEDCRAIREMIDADIEMTIDEYGRVFNEGGQYIADGIEGEPGTGIAC